METNELRLGNWIEQDLGEGKRSIPMYVSSIFDNYVYLDFNENEGDVWETDAKYLVGIPLTDEILSKLCTKESFGYYTLQPTNVCIDVAKRVGDDFYYIFCNLKVLKEVRYVHELQNIYFVLTSQELKIEL